MHKKYIENAEEKLEAAEYLLRGGFYNDAVSRAYYSMFYSAKALLSLKEIYPKAHKGVITKFGLEFVKKGFVEDVYGHALSHAKDRREVADYDIEKNISEEEAESIVEDAERFLVRIKEAINAIQKKLD
ncbi:MAG: HEPN domain-containing protein [Proteobacteria bacterium]|nr:HEPN domain-containing protein [Pseudomonadota bacterium]